VPICSLKISHGLTWRRTWASAVRGRRLTAWATARSWSSVTVCYCYDDLRLHMSVWNWVSNRPIVHPPDDIWANMEQRWNDTGRGNRRTHCQRKPVQCRFVHTKPDTKCPGNGFFLFGIQQHTASYMAVFTFATVTRLNSPHSTCFVCRYQQINPRPLRRKFVWVDSTTFPEQLRLNDLNKVIGDISVIF
jgi:hypothetical protein